MALLKLMRSRPEGEDHDLVAVDHRDFIVGGAETFPRLAPLNLSSVDLTDIAIAATNLGFRLVEVQLGDEGGGPLPEGAKDLERDIVIAVRSRSHRDANRVLAKPGRRYHIRWLELADMETDERVRISRYGVIQSPIDELGGATLTRVISLVSDLNRSGPEDAQG